jgi:hypothetical protein
MSAMDGMKVTIDGRKTSSTLLGQLDAQAGRRSSCGGDHAIALDPNSDTAVFCLNRRPAKLNDLRHPKSVGRVQRH